MPSPAEACPWVSENERWLQVLCSMACAFDKALLLLQRSLCLAFMCPPPIHPSQVHCQGRGGQTPKLQVQNPAEGLPGLLCFCFLQKHYFKGSMWILNIVPTVHTSQGMCVVSSSGPVLVFKANLPGLFIFFPVVLSLSHVQLL